MSDTDTMDRTNTIIRALFENGACTDYASEYGEPGYRADGPVLLGDWWCRRQDCNYPERYDNGQRKVHGMEYHYPRMFTRLEADGCEFAWYDEWTIVDDRAYRTEPDSYSWEPTAVFNQDTCEYMIVGEDVDEWLEWATNDPSRALMSRSFSDNELAEHGFHERTCELESGWYGQEDDPRAIFAALEEEGDVLFMLSGVEQFRITFCVYVREYEGKEGED